MLRMLCAKITWFVCHTKKLVRTGSELKQLVPLVELASGAIAIANQVFVTDTKRTTSS